MIIYNKKENLDDLIRESSLEVLLIWHLLWMVCQVESIKIDSNINRINLNLNVAKIGCRSLDKNQCMV
jgi:hypothetical protein